MTGLTARLRKGFTLLELIVVIVILGILAAIAIPTFSAVISKSKDSSGATSLRSLNRNVQALSALDRANRTNVTAADIETAIKELKLSGASAFATPVDGGTNIVDGDYTKIGYSTLSTGYGLAFRSQSGACLMLANASGVSTLFKSTTGNCNGDRAIQGKQTADSDVAGAGVASGGGVVTVPAAVSVSKSFAATSNTGTTGTISSWTVPSTGAYTLSAVGANGGAAPQASNGTLTGVSIPGGLGATVSGTFTLTKDDVIQVLVGQKGGSIAGNVRGAGGGGGTFIYNQTKSQILLVAGGGGGAGQYAPNNLRNDPQNASLNTSGKQGGTSLESGAQGGPGGTGGTSGGYSSSNFGGPGGGLNGSVSASSYGKPGNSFLSGGVGGEGYQVFNNDGAHGGFGGGGGSFAAGGGGGGYSGGGGGNWHYSGSGGGGGSFNGGTDQTADLVSSQDSGVGSASIVSK